MMQLADFDVILDVVQAHHDRGTPRATVLRALIDLAADSVAPTIRECVRRVYGD